MEGGSRSVFATDFDSRIDVIPVSDPNVSSETQRIAQAQAMLQLAQQFPEQHNLREALRRMHEVLGTKKIEGVLNPERGPKLMDPATENFAISMGRPVKAYQFQDHQAHAMCHQSLLMQAQQQAMANPAMAQVVATVTAHITEHQAHMARMMIEQASGVQLPPPPDYDPTDPNKEDGYEIDPEMERQIAAAQGQAAMAIAQQQQQLAQMQQNAQAAQDPMLQLKQQEVAIKGQAVQQKAAEAQTKAQLEVQKIQNAQANDAARIRLDANEVKLKAKLEREQMVQDTEVARINAAGKAKQRKAP